VLSRALRILLSGIKNITIFDKCNMSDKKIALLGLGYVGLPLQIHHKRSEHWVVVSGSATVVNGKEVFILEKGEWCTA